MESGAAYTSDLSPHPDKQEGHQSKSLRKKERVIRSILPAVWPRKEEFDSIGSSSAVLRQYTSYTAARLSACDARDIERLAEWVRAQTLCDVEA